MRLGRSRPPAPWREPVIELAEAAADAAKRRLYAEGIADGIAITLKLLLNEASASEGGTPYKGPMPAPLEKWARAALVRVRSA